jgi:hypothetical protein
MIDASRRVHAEILAQAVVSAGSKGRQAQSQSFGAVLSDKLAKSEALTASATASQRIAPWRDPISTPGRTNSPSPTPASTPAPSGLNGLVPPSPSAGAPGTAGAAGAQSLSQPLNSDQEYWASQPAAVQQLQNIQDPTERTQVAEQLSTDGYSIDVPIMVWGWDPSITTALRQSLGYTWVPSAQQQGVEVAPGLTFGGAKSYDPTQPPAGSIMV